MSSSLAFVQYVCDQIQETGEITWKRMFGEYGIYVDGIYCGAICDNQFFVKETKEGKAVWKDCIYGEMYPGAKPSFLIENLQDKEQVVHLLRISKEALQKQKKSTKKPKK